MAGGFCIKAVTRYAVLYDVYFSFCLALARPLFCNEQILFLSVLISQSLFDIYYGVAILIINLFKIYL